ncbi:MAG: hypothetical protein SVU69_12290 [Pseudomonadota bacterium]|nr:hypothetical protein [Pseudomonadota bacterium]
MALSQISARDGETYLIELRLSGIQQLFDTLDPAPFLEKDLDTKVVSYLVESVEELPRTAPIKLIFHSSKHTDADAARWLPEAIHNYFAYRADLSRRELRELLRRGRTSLVVGLIFLFSCIAMGEVIGSFTTGMTASVAREGLLIGGWVAMWRPIEIFLYDWWPIRAQRRLAIRLAQAPVELRTEPHS